VIGALAKSRFAKAAPRQCPPGKAVVDDRRRCSGVVASRMA